MTKNYIPGLDGMRAFAVALVYFEHKVLSGFLVGSLGVDVFFCLSGFLIIGILHSQRLSIESGKSRPWDELKIFWQKRARRIFPVYYAAVAFAIVSVYLQSRGVFSSGLVPWYLLISPNIFIGYVSKGWTEFTHLWSIGVEQHFYMLISPILLMVPAVHHRATLLVLFFCSIAIMWLQYISGDHAITIYVSSPGNFFFMAAGGLLALRDKSRDGGRNSKDIAVFLIAFVLFVILSKSSVRELIDRSLFRVFCGLLGLVVGVALLRHVVLQPDSRLVAVLELRPIRYWGAVSYGFYVYHTLVPSIPALMPGLAGQAISVVVHFSLCIALSAASWHLVESRLLGRRRVKLSSQPLSVAR